jgi:hypothetical protein
LSSTKICHYGGRRVSRWSLATCQAHAIADIFKGDRFDAPNDLWIDTKRRILVPRTRATSLES